MSTQFTASYDHVAITVGDMKRSIAFYRDLLGCEVMGQLLLRDGQFRIVYLRTGAAVIELFEFAENGKPHPGDMPDEDLGLKHICFTVEDVDAYAEHLRSHGVQFIVEPKTAATTPLRLAFFRDPDGNKIEITSGELKLLPLDI